MLSRAAWGAANLIKVINWVKKESIEDFLKWWVHYRGVTKSGWAFRKTRAVSGEWPTANRWPPWTQTGTPENPSTPPGPTALRCSSLQSNFWLDLNNKILKRHFELLGSRPIVALVKQIVLTRSLSSFIAVKTLVITDLKEKSTVKRSSLFRSCIKHFVREQETLTCLGPGPI